MAVQGTPATVFVPLKETSSDDSSRTPSQKSGSPDGTPVARRAGRHGKLQDIPGNPLPKPEPETLDLSQLPVRMHGTERSSAANMGTQSTANRSLATRPSSAENGRRMTDTFSGQRQPASVSDFLRRPETRAQLSANMDDATCRQFLGQLVAIHRDNKVVREDFLVEQYLRVLLRMSDEVQHGSRSLQDPDLRQILRDMLLVANNLTAVQGEQQELRDCLQTLCEQMVQAGSRRNAVTTDGDAGVSQVVNQALEAGDVIATCQIRGVFVPQNLVDRVTRTREMAIEAQAARDTAAAMADDPDCSDEDRMEAQWMQGLRQDRLTHSLARLDECIKDPNLFQGTTTATRQQATNELSRDQSNRSELIKARISLKHVIPGGIKAVDRAAGTQAGPVTDHMNSEMMSQRLMRPQSAPDFIAAMDQMLALYDKSPTLQADPAFAQAAAFARTVSQQGPAADAAGNLNPELRRAGRMLHMAAERHAQPGIRHLLGTVYSVLQCRDAPPAALDEAVRTMDILTDLCLDRGLAIPPVLVKALPTLRQFRQQLIHAEHEMMAATAQDDAAAVATAKTELDETRGRLRHFIDRLRNQITPLWQEHFGSAEPPAGEFKFLHTRHLNTNFLNHYLVRKPLLLAHEISSKISHVWAKPYSLLSPSGEKVHRHNLQHIHQLRQGDGLTNSPRDDLVSQFTPKILNEVRGQILDVVRNAALHNTKGVITKAVGQLRGKEPEDIHQTRAELVAEMMDLTKPDSAINLALARVAPQYATGMPLDAMPKMTRSAFMMTLSASILDEATKPTRAEAENAAEIIARLAPKLQKEVEEIHLEYLHKVMEIAQRDPSVFRDSDVKAYLRHPLDHDERVLHLMDDAMEECNKKVQKANERAYDAFRKEHRTEFGYNKVKEELRINSGREYYRDLLRGTPNASAVLSVIPQLLGLIDPTHTGKILKFVAQAIVPLFANHIGQFTAGMLGGASGDFKMLEPAPATVGRNDPRAFKIERDAARAIRLLSTKASDAYVRPGNPAHQACTDRFMGMRDKGYTDASLALLSPRLDALCKLDVMLNGNPSIGFNDVVAAPVRISGLLHKFAADLPNLNSLCSSPKGITPAECDVIMQNLIQAICRDPKHAQIDQDAMLHEINRVAAESVADMEERGLSAAAYGASMAPGEAMLRTCGSELMTVIESLLQTCLRKEQELHSSASFLGPQFKGLQRNAISSLVLLTVIAAGGMAATGALLALLGPVGGMVGGLATTTVGLTAGKLTRDNAGAKWFTEDAKKQTHNSLHKVMNAKQHSPFASDADKAALRDGIISAYEKTHTSPLLKRKDQIDTLLRAHFEDQLVEKNNRMVENGTQVLATIEASLGPSNDAVRLAALSIAAERKGANAVKHKAVVDEAAEMTATVNQMAERTKTLLDLPARGPDATAMDQVARDHAHEQKEGWATRRANKYLNKQADYVPDATGNSAAKTEIHALRARLTDKFDQYITRNQIQLGFGVSEQEWRSTCAAFRVSGTDDRTETWIATTEQRLRDTGLLKAGTEPLHLQHTRTPGADKALAHWNSSMEEIAERTRMMQTLMHDAMCLQAARYEDIQDPTGMIQAYMDSSVLSFEDVKRHRVVGAQHVGLARGARRNMGAFHFVTPAGLATFVAQLATLGIQGWEASGKMPKITVLKDAAAFKPKGFNLNVSNLGGTFVTTGQGAINPASNPLSFAAAAQVHSFDSGFKPNYEGFTDAVSDVVANNAAYALWPDPNKEGKLLDIGGVEQRMVENAGVTKAHSHSAMRVKKPHFELTPTQKEAWSDAIKLSKKGPFAYMADFLDPKSTFKTARYGKYGRLHYDKKKQDMERIAGNFAKVMVMAGELERSPNSQSAQQLAFMHKAFEAIRRNPQASQELLGALAQVAPGQARTLFNQIGTAITSDTMLDPWTRLIVGVVYQNSLPVPQDDPDAATPAAPSPELQAADEANQAVVQEVLDDAHTVVNQKIRQLQVQAQRDAPLSQEQQHDMRYATDKLKAQLGVLETYAPEWAQHGKEMLAHVEATAAGIEVHF